MATYTLRCIPDPYVYRRAHVNPGGDVRFEGIEGVVSDHVMPRPQAARVLREWRRLANGRHRLSVVGLWALEVRR